MAHPYVEDRYVEIDGDLMRAAGPNQAERIRYAINEALGFCNFKETEALFSRADLVTMRVTLHFYDVDDNGKRTLL